MDTLFDIVFDDQPVKKSKTKETRNSKKTVQKKAEKKEQTQESGWISYTKESRPDIGVPCKFRVKTDSGYSNVFYGYIEFGGYMCTNDTQLIRLKQKYGNAEYKPISDCASVSGCQYGYLNCANCTKNK